jgi:hypothetical protein
MMLMATYCDDDDSVEVDKDGYDMLRMITLLICKDSDDYGPMADADE